MTPRTVLLALLIALCACNRAPENKDAVRAGIVEHLGKNSGLDLGSMDIDIQNVDFKGDTATATVSFKPKSSPDAGMSMNYTLERQGAKWAVKKTGAGGHSGMGTQQTAPPPGGALPPGHPPVAPDAAPQK